MLNVKLTVDKRHCRRQVGMLGRNGKSCPKGKELPELYSGTFYRISTLFPNTLQRLPPEGTYKALEKFGLDLTKQARDGKLDPVIGRDAEIRRVVQVLSRRTLQDKRLQNHRLIYSHDSTLPGCKICERFCNLQSPLINI